MAAAYDDGPTAVAPAPVEREEHRPTDGQTALFNAYEDAVECSRCGGTSIRTGACYTCMDCGENTGCG